MAFKYSSKVTDDQSSKRNVVEIEFNTGFMFMIDHLIGGIPALYLRPHRHRFYEMVWIQEGNGSHLIDFEEYTFRENRIYLITPGQIHRWRECNVKAYVIQFTDALLDNMYSEIILQGAELFTEGLAKPFLDLPAKSRQLLCSLASLMEDEYAADEIDWNMVRPLLSAFLYELSRLGRDNNTNLLHPDYHRLATLRELIDTYYTQHKPVDFFAKHLSITSKRLNEITRDIVDKSVSQLIHERIILDAKRDLSQSQDSIKVIAYRLGFEDPSYFGRFFRRIAGQSPNAFREEFQQISPSI